MSGLDERKNGSGPNGDRSEHDSIEAKDNFLLLPRASLTKGVAFSRSSLWLIHLESWSECFGFTGGLVISCKALRDVRTFRSYLESFAGVKNFLKRLGVIVGGLIGFLDTVLLSGQPGDESGQLLSV